MREGNGHDNYEQNNYQQDKYDQDNYKQRMDSVEASVCTGCAKVILEGSVIAFGEEIYHLDCFRCTKCKAKIDSEQSNILLSDGLPVCQHCSYICAVCRKPIVDEAIMTGVDAYHANCFNCVLCKKNIESTTFAKSSNGIYCMACLENRRQKKKNPRWLNSERVPLFRRSTIEPLSSSVLDSGSNNASTSPSAKSATGNLSRAAALADCSATDKEWYSAQEVQLFKDQIVGLREGLGTARRQIEAFRTLNERALYQINQATEEIGREVLRRQSVETLLEKLQVDYVNLLKRIKSSDDPSLAALLEDAREITEQNKVKFLALPSRRASVFTPRELTRQPWHAAPTNGVSVPHLATVTVRSSSLKHPADGLQPHSSDVVHAKDVPKRIGGPSDAPPNPHILPLQRSSPAADVHCEAESVTVKKAITKDLTAVASSEKLKPRVLRWMPRGPRPRPPREHPEKVSHSAEEEEPANSSHPKSHSFIPHLFRRPTKCRACGDKMWSLQTKELRCQKCGYHVHNKCASHTTDSCSGSAPECNSADDGSSPRAKGAGMFGGELEKQVESGQNEIPDVVEKCILAIERRGMDIEGIYRKTGPTVQMRLLQSQFEKGVPPDLLNEDVVDDVTAITSLLKLYLRELPEPLLTFKLYDDWIESLGIEDHVPRLARVCELLQLLPNVNRLTLKRLCLHLAEVATLQETNRMSAKNLSVVFGPTLTRCADNEKDMINMGKRNSVVHILIEHAAVLFCGENEKAGNSAAIEESATADLEESASVSPSS